MDELTKEMARAYMKKVTESSPRPDKFPVPLPESRDRSAALLLGIYGSEVEGRGMEFQMDDATVSKVERIVKWMYDSRKRGLLLCGTLGNGKTTMLRTLKKFFGARAVYYEAQDVYDYFRQSQGFPPVSAEEILLIDDLGVEPSTYNDFGDVRYPLAELLMKRYKLNRPTLIATNCTFEQIGRIYGERLQDRMREMFATITYTEPSYRK